jgi:hypothetical protein
LVVPVSMKWTGTELGAGVSARPYTARGNGSVYGRSEVTHRLASRTDKQLPRVIPAKATVDFRHTKPRVSMAKAVQKYQPAATLLVFRSSQVGESGAPVWTLSVWRVTAPNGQTVQEMIVMNSI